MNNLFRPFRPKIQILAIAEKILYASVDTKEAAVQAIRSIVLVHGFEL